MRTWESEGAFPGSNGGLLFFSSMDMISVTPTAMPNAPRHTHLPMVLCCDEMCVCVGDAECETVLNLDHAHRTYLCVFDIGDMESDGLVPYQRQKEVNHGSETQPQTECYTSSLSCKAKMYSLWSNLIFVPGHSLSCCHHIVPKPTKQPSWSSFPKRFRYQHCL